MKDDVLQAIHTLIRALRESDPNAGSVMHPVLMTSTTGEPISVRVLVTFDPGAVAELDAAFGGQPLADDA